MREWKERETKFMRHLGNISRTGKTQDTKDFGTVNLGDLMAKKSRAVKDPKRKGSLISGSKTMLSRIKM